MTVTGNQEVVVVGSNHRNSDDIVMVDEIKQNDDDTNYDINQEKSLMRPLAYGCEDKWTWNKRDRSQEVRLSGPCSRTVHFHPNWSKGTAGIRGSRVLNNGRYYWEIKVSQRVFGTR